MGAEPMPMPTSMLPPTTAVLISAPEPTSLQSILAPASFSNQPSALARTVGWVERKNATLNDVRRVGRRPAGCARGKARPAAGRAGGAHEQAAAGRGDDLMLLSSQIVAVGLLWAAGRPAVAAARPLSPARPSGRDAVRAEEQAIQDQPHRPDQEDADKDVVGAQEAAGIEDHPAQPGAAGDDLGRDQRGVDHADRQPGAGEDLGQGRGQDHVPEHLPAVGAQRSARHAMRCAEVLRTPSMAAIAETGRAVRNSRITWAVSPMPNQTISRTR